MGTFEYQIRKDIRNNPIVREVDQARVRELWRSTGVGCLFLLLLLYSAWQHFELIRYGYRVERLQQERASEEQINRHLRLQLQSLRRPQRIETIARRQLKMVQPGPDEAVVLERGPVTTDDGLGFWTIDTDGSVMVAWTEGYPRFTVDDCDPVTGACEQVGRMTTRGGDPQFLGNDM